MEINLSLSKLIAEAAGTPDAFNPQFQQVVGDKLTNRDNYGLVAGSPYYGTDANGREVYLPVTVNVGNGIVPNADGTPSGHTYAEALGVTDGNGNYTGVWTLPYATIDPSLMVHVIDTELTERNGMVSELINISGFKISVKGYLVGQGNEFPEADFTTLCRLCALRVPMTVINPVTDILLQMNEGSNMVTIRAVKMPQKRGKKAVWDYEIELISEVPFNLTDIS